MKLLRRSYLLFLAAPALWPAFAPERWLYRQRITTASPVTRLTLDKAVYDGAAFSLADLRVIRDGNEVPYLLTVAGATRQTGLVAVRIVNKESRAGVLFVTLELNTSDPHNQLQLAVRREDFRSQLTIEASDDGRQWATVRRSAYIFRYRADDGQIVEHTTLRYPDSRRRYVRLAIAGWPDPEQFTGASVLFDRSSQASRSEIWSIANLPAAALTVTRSTCSILDTGTRAPRDRAELTVTDAGPFHRGVTMEEGSDGKSWSHLGSGAIYRIRGEESLSLDFPETRKPFQRVCIYQGDDKPVMPTGIRLLGIDRAVTFRSEAAGTYWLYYGRASAEAPSYDIARTAGDEFVTAKAGSLSAREANPAYKPPPAPVLPWTERFPGLLYAVLAVAVAGLGWMTLRLLRS